MIKKETKKESAFFPLAVSAYHESVVLIYANKTLNETKLFLSGSENGLNFFTKNQIDIFDQKGKRAKLAGLNDLSFFSYGPYHYLLYSQGSGNKKETIIAKSTNLLRFEIIEKGVQIPGLSVKILSGHKHKKSFLTYYGGKSVQVAASDNLKDWHSTGGLLPSKKKYFDEHGMDVIATMLVDRGIFVLYKAEDKKIGSQKIKIGGALFSLDRPYVPVWRSDDPIWEEKLSKEKYPERFLGATIIRDSLHIYLSSASHDFFVKTIDLSGSGLNLNKNVRVLKRHHANPILKPKAGNGWENDATFNPAAIHLDGKIHLIYRAIGENGVSVFGYASSKDGINIDERLDYPIFALSHPLKIAKRKPALKNVYVSGGSWAGCEDPRITRIGNRIYMTYVMFDGWNPPGVGMTSISVKDFCSKVWKWKKPMFISKPGQIQKNWMVFPEKINGKYAVLHSITPKISIEYVDSLQDDKLTIESMKMPGVDEHRWDNIVRGAGAPPLKTKHGWLVLYHAMDKRDPNKYKVGAMLLDHNDPTKILHRCKHPILEPDAHYENNGAKAGVVYVCGAVIKDNLLLVYYGGADSVVCVASENLDEFLEDLTKHVVEEESLLNKLKKPKQK